MTRIDTLCLVGSPGTNKVMNGELARLSRRALSRVPRVQEKQGSGILHYPFDPQVAQLATRYHRTSTRILWGLWESTATRLEPLFEQLVTDIAADDRSWLKQAATISVYASNVGRFEAGERQIVGVVKNAILVGAESLGITLRVDADQPDITIGVRMHDNRVWVGVDLLGRSLSQRGYRIARGMAPLREHLAASIVDARTV